MLFDEELSVYEQNGDKWYLAFATYSICIYLYWGLELANFDFTLTHDTLRDLTQPQRTQDGLSSDSQRPLNIRR